MTISLYGKDIVEPYCFKDVRKQPSASVLQNRRSWKFWKIHRKTLVLESLFNKVARLQRLHHYSFHMIFLKFSRTLYIRTLYTTKIAFIRKNIFVCLFSVHNTISLSHHEHARLTLSWRGPLSYRNQSIYSLCKSMDWFLYDNGLRDERVNSPDDAWSISQNVA